MTISLLSSILHPAYYLIYDVNHNREFEFYDFQYFLKFTIFFTDFKTVNIKIHKIQIITFIAAKFQQTLRPEGSI